MEWNILKNNELDEDMLNKMYEMYLKTYQEAQQNIWYKSKESLLYYTCSIMTGVFEGKIICYIMYQIRPYANKISLSGHDGTALGKKYIMEKKEELLCQPGWIVEAAGAVSWILRKNNIAPIILDVNKITAALSIDIINESNMIEFQKIVINPNFDKNDKFSYAYMHQYINKETNKIIQNEETLFGRLCEEFDSLQCNRNCMKNQTGGIQKYTNTYDYHDKYLKYKYKYFNLRNAIQP